MNDTFAIPDRSSLYNIKSIYNALVEELGQSGQVNMLINGKLLQTAYDSTGGSIVPGWTSDTLSAIGPVLTLGSGDDLTQHLPRLHPNEIYTVVLDIRNVVPVTLSILGSVGSEIFDFFDGTNDPVYDIPVAYDDTTSPIRQQVAFSFRTGSHSEVDPPRLVIAQGTTSSLTIFNSAIAKGTFGFATDSAVSLWMDTIRLVDSGTEAFYEVSKNGVAWNRVLTFAPEDIAALFATGSFLTIAQLDARFIRGDVADSAAGLITFNGGLESTEDIQISGYNKNLRLAQGDIVVNTEQVPGGLPPNRSFYISVHRGDQPTVGLRYNEGSDKWEFTHDGYEWKAFGSGDAVAGSASSELEFFAEILDKSGFKDGVYDLFQTEGAPDDVLPTNAIYYADEGGYYIPESSAPAPWTLRTENIWPADATGTDYSMFVHALTNQDEDAGMTISYSRTDEGGLPPAVDSTLWEAWSHNDIMQFPGTTSQFYIKFAFDSTDVQMHSYGLFYGHWNYIYSTDTRLREWYTVPGASTPPTIITIPNAARYTPDGESLEVYHNRARLITGIDYEEVSDTQIRMLVAIQAGDVLEFYEKYGYVMDSTSADVLDAHIANTTTAHGIDTIITSVSDHVNDTVGAHAATAISFDPSGLAEFSATTVQAALAEVNTYMTTYNGGIVDVNVSAAHQITESNRGKRVVVDVAGAVNITLPQNTTEAIPAGFQCAVRLEGAGSLTFVTEGADVLHSPGGATQITTQYAEAIVTKKAAGVWELNGDIA